MADPDLAQRLAELREEVERYHQLTELTASRGWELFADRVKRDSLAIQDRILTGRLDQGDYQHQAGIIVGFRRVIDLPVRVQEEYEAAALELAQAQEDAGGE